jgi:hypothetical protein
MKLPGCSNSQTVIQSGTLLFHKKIISLVQGLVTILSSFLKSAKLVVDEHIFRLSFFFCGSVGVTISFLVSLPVLSQLFFIHASSVYALLLDYDSF